jgi:hypothetical protein
MHTSGTDFGLHSMGLACLSSSDPSLSAKPLEINTKEAFHRHLSERMKRFSAGSVRD